MRRFLPVLALVLVAVFLCWSCGEPQLDLRPEPGGEATSHSRLSAHPRELTAALQVKFSEAGWGRYNAQVALGKSVVPEREIYLYRRQGASGEVRILTQARAGVAFEFIDEELVAGQEIFYALAPRDMRPEMLSFLGRRFWVPADLKLEGTKTVEELRALVPPGAWREKPAGIWTLSLGRLVLGSEGEILSDGLPFHLVVENLKADRGARIANFGRAGKAVDPGKAGRSAAWLAIEVRQGRGALELSARGETGATGVAGAAGRRGRDGRKGRDGTVRSSPGRHDDGGGVERCETRPLRGTVGTQGLRGKNGGKGGLGGAGAQLAVRVIEKSELHWIPDTEGGDGGVGGVGGKGGLGGLRGAPGRAPHPCTAPSKKRERAASGADGITGAWGSPGKEGRFCLASSEKDSLESCLQPH